MKVILPKTAHRIDPGYGPLFFLAGPVLGGGDWQHACVKELQKSLNQFYVAIPKRYTHHPLVRFQAADDRSTLFTRQLTWERFYLNLAARNGCVIFWLPHESTSSPRKDGQPYARDTYGELGEWRGHLVHDTTLRVVIGGECGFPGIDIIEDNFKYALESRYSPFYRSLSQLTKAAIHKASKRT